MQAPSLQAKMVLANILVGCAIVGSQAADAGQPLTGHSITTPPAIATLAQDWFMAGTVIPSTKSLVLQPGVPNRLGYIWSKYPVLTNDFDIELEFSVKAPAERTVKDDGFALWYVQENVTAVLDNITTSHLHNQEAIIANTWSTAFTEQNFQTLGYRDKFDGVGVFFTNGGQNKDEPTVGAVAGDGKSSYTIGTTLPNAEAQKYDFRQGGKKNTVKVIFRPNGIKLKVEGGPSQQVNCDIKAGGYIGLSIFGGTKGKVETSERSDMVEVFRMSVANHDKSAKGEDLPKPEVAEMTTKSPEEKTDVLHETSDRKDHRAESEAIKALTNMVFKLIVESQPMRTQMTKSIESLDKRVSAMEKTFESLKQELDKRTGHNLGAEFEAIKKELTSLSDVASTETQARHKKLESLHADIAHVHKSATSADSIDTHLSKLTESNKRTMENLNSEHSRMFGVSIAAIAFICIAGLSLYNKFRCWEKKHVL